MDALCARSVSRNTYDTSAECNDVRSFKVCVEIFETVFPGPSEHLLSFLT